MMKKIVFFGLIFLYLNSQAALILELNSDPNFLGQDGLQGTFVHQGVDYSKECELHCETEVFEGGVPLISDLEEGASSEEAKSDRDGGVSTDQ